MAPEQTINAHIRESFESATLELPYVITKDGKKRLDDFEEYCDQDDCMADYDCEVISYYGTCCDGHFVFHRNMEIAYIKSDAEKVSVSLNRNLRILNLYSCQNLTFMSSGGDYSNLKIHVYHSNGMNLQHQMLQPVSELKITGTRKNETKVYDLFGATNELQFCKLDDFEIKIDEEKISRILIRDSIITYHAFHLLSQLNVGCIKLARVAIVEDLGNLPKHLNRKNYIINCSSWDRRGGEIIDF